MILYFTNCCDYHRYCIEGLSKEVYDKVYTLMKSGEEGENEDDLETQVENIIGPTKMIYFNYIMQVCLLLVSHVMLRVLTIIYRLSSVNIVCKWNNMYIIIHVGYVSMCLIATSTKTNPSKRFV